MSKIIKENGSVYLVQEWDIEGRHISKFYLGKDPDYIEEKPKKKKKTKKEDEK